jgi:hypothetical protein
MLKPSPAPFSVPRRRAPKRLRSRLNQTEPWISPIRYGVVQEAICGFCGISPSKPLYHSYTPQSKGNPNKEDEQDI